MHVLMIGHLTGKDYSELTGPGRASPVPAATLDAFRAPYAGQVPHGCASRLYTASMAFTLISGARHSLSPPEDGTSNDAAGFASCYGPHRRSPLQGF